MPSSPKLHDRPTWRPVAAAVVVLVVAWVAYRFLYTLDQPVLFGWDPYIRALHRDEVVVSLFGRRWPPLLQLLIVGVTRAGGELVTVRAVLAVAGALLLAGVFLLAQRQSGFVAGVIALLLLSTSADVLLTSATLYQESLFYLLVMLIAWKVLPDWKGESLPLLGVLVLLATTCRYEGLLVGIALVVVLMSRAGMRQALKAAPLLVLPSAIFYVAYTRLQDDSHSALSRGVQLEAVARNARHLLDYLTGWEALPILAIAAVGWWLQRGRRGAAFSMLDAFVVLFALLYVFVQPFHPFDNRRFHLPFVVWTNLYAALTLATLCGLAQKRSRWMFALLVVALLGNVASRWQALDRDMQLKTARHRSHEALGERIGKLAGQRRIVTNIPPLTDRLRPGERFQAFMTGPASCLHHDPSLEAVTAHDVVLVRSTDAQAAHFENLGQEEAVRRHVELEPGLRLYLPIDLPPKR